MCYQSMSKAMIILMNISFVSPPVAQLISALVFLNVLSDRYTMGGSHVFASFLDFSTAFDKVSYWKLFHKLLHRESKNKTPYS